MGEVVSLHLKARRRAPAAPPEGSAQILFFLGVRYCRHEDESGGKPSRRRSGTPRPRRKKRA
jgi:hypothetical protein